MNAATIATVLMAILGTLSIAGAGAAWLYRRGKDEQALSNSVERHAIATEDLAGQVSGLRTTLEGHSVTLTEHHFRLKALEGSK
jgi:hypothetical protein